MKKETIFEIALKLLGIYLITLWIPILNQIIGISFISNESFDYYYFIPQISSFAFIIFIQIVLIFKAKSIAKFVCENDEVQEQKLEANQINEYSIIKIAFVISGLIVLVNSLVDLFSFLQLIVEQFGMKLESDDPFSGAYQYVFKFICGLALISFSSFFAKKLAKSKN